MRRAPAIALTIVLLSVFLSPLQRELYVGDETKYSQVVREMRATGSLLLPTLEGSPFTHKPPLHFWTIDLLTQVFGVYSIWPFVIPSLVAFALLLLLMRAMGGTMAAFVCGTTLLMWGSAQTARMDVAFATLLALSAWLMLRSNGRLTIGAGIATGLAFLVKGPMAPVITLSLFIIESIRRRSGPSRIERGVRSRPRTFLAIVAMLAIPLLWLVPAIIVGGEPFWREIFFKQTVGRAVGAWVHKSPPWFYLERAPLTLLPWFFLAIPALFAAWRRDDERAKFAVSWILAVLIPYSLLSSKLDVYMITMLPAVALLIARYVDRDDSWGRTANFVTLLLFAAAGGAGLFVQPQQLEGDAAVFIARTDIRVMFGILLAASIVAMIVTLRGRLVASTLATGLVLVVTFAYAALVLVPTANELASTRPLVRALEQQPFPPESVALYMTPHLWTRGMRPELWRARHVDANELRQSQPALIVTRRKDAADIADVLRSYHKVDELQMIGKWFDVYRR